MDPLKFFKLRTNLAHMYLVAQMQRWKKNAPSGNLGAYQNEREQHEQPRGPEQSVQPNQPRRRVFDPVVIKLKMAISPVKDFLSNSIHTIKEKGILGAAKEVGEWMKAHPWETALIVAPIVATITTAIILLAIGFGPTGVAAGSTAAIIQAGIGNVVAHSLFATCTSAMMGGYGAPIIFGGVWILATVATTTIGSAWKWWNSHNDRRLIPMPKAPPKDFSKQSKDAAESFIIGSMLVAAYVTYRIKSWLQSRRGPKSD